MQGRCAIIKNLHHDNEEYNDFQYLKLHLLVL